MSVVQLHSGRFDRPRVLWIAPTATRLRVTIAAIMKKLTNSMLVNAGNLLLLNIPEELIEDDSAQSDQAWRQLAHLAIEQPGLGISGKFFKTQRIRKVGR